MAYASAFDLFIAVIFWSSVGSMCLAVGVMLVIPLVRLRRANDARRDAEVSNAWRKICVGALTGRVERVRSVRKRDAFVVLSLWNAFNRMRHTDRIDVEACRRNLRAIALKAGLAALAERQLGGDLSDQLVAATTLGILRSSRGAKALSALINGADGDLSLSAATALLQIDARFSTEFLKHLACRGDWPATKVESVLREHAALLAAEYWQTLRSVDEDQRLRLLRFLPLMGSPTARAAVVSLLAVCTDPETIASCLRVLGRFVVESDVGALLAYAGYENHAVRIQAVNALARLELPGVTARMLTFVTDPDAWVRFRSAEAIAQAWASCPAGDSALSGMRDTFGREMLTYACANRRETSDALVHDFRAADLGLGSRAPLAESA